MEKKHFVGIFIAAIMIFSVAGFTMEMSEGTLKSGGMTFQRTNQGFLTKVNGEKLYFTMLPEQVENIKLDSRTEQLLQNKVIITTYDPNDELAESISLIQYEMQQNIKKKIIVPALTNSTGYKLSEINCKNATMTQTVILMKQGDLNITTEGNCIIVTAKNSQDIIAQGTKIEYTLI